MKLILNNIKVGINETDEEILSLAAEILTGQGIKAKNMSLCRKSLDARRKSNIHYMCAVLCDTELCREEIVALNNCDIRPFEEIQLDLRKREAKEKTIVVGTGSCGLFAAYILARAGLSPLVIERGDDVDKRSEAVRSFWLGKPINKNTNVQFGEGGAGTFSDGKLTTRIGDPLCRVVLEEFVRFGAPKDILYKAKPHIGTDNLKNVVKNIREEIKRLGGEVKFNSCLTDIKVRDGKIAAVYINGEETECDNLVLATGHSSRDTYEMLYLRGAAMNAKAFAAGVRIEHAQSFINEMQYGKGYEKLNLPAADYRLTYNGEKRSCYSFCMCPGGTVVNASSEEGALVVNGMSEYKRAEKNANSALVVTVLPSDFESESPLAGIEFQRKYERLAYLAGGGNYCAPVQLARDFVNHKISSSFDGVFPSYTGKTAFASLDECLPDFISKTLREGLLSFEKKAKGYLCGGSVLTGVEMRTSAPVRILRGEDFECVNIKNLYPSGEGAGYAGGIMSAAVDGIRVALKIIDKI